MKSLGLVLLVVSFTSCRIGGPLTSKTFSQHKTNEDFVIEEETVAIVEDNYLIYPNKHYFYTDILDQLKFSHEFGQPIQRRVLQRPKLTHECFDRGLGILYKVSCSLLVDDYGEVVAVSLLTHDQPTVDSCILFKMNQLKFVQGDHWEMGSYTFKVSYDN